MRRLSSTLETSAATALATPPPFRISVAAASAWDRSLAAMSTRAPCLAKTRAIPFPIPLLAPVTITERPSIDVSTCDPLGAKIGYRTREIQTLSPPSGQPAQWFDGPLAHRS